MDIKNDILYKAISDKVKAFGKEAKSHKRMSRALWITSAVISVLVAISSNMSFSVFGLTSAMISSVLSIILPVVTGYTVLRSPESLWLLEIDTRNRLQDLALRLELAAGKGHDFNREKIETEYFEVMKSANERWKEIKQAK